MHPLAAAGIKALILTNLLMAGAAFLLLMERKILGYMQYRVGPNRVGPWGLFQPVADVVKMIMKEDIVPKDADQVVFRMAPIIAAFTALASFAVIPFGPAEWQIVADPNAGLLIILAVGSLSVYGIALGGWASQSKYSLLGSMRATAQMISYELAMGFALVGVLINAGSVRISEIVAIQSAWPMVFAFGYGFPQIAGLLVFFVAVLAETNRAPFDLPEAEAELVGGYNTEFAGMRFGMFFIAELVHMITVCTLVALFYLGGWNAPALLTGFLPDALVGTLWLLLKVCLLLFVFIWLRATMPRLRYDRLMAFGWKVMLPVALVNLVVTAIYVALWA
jgi:NADH-quinone oxidoreductase subunit H